jgi:calcium-dependent protein kinase
LAKGAFGTVYKGTHKHTETPVAIKVIKKERLAEREVHMELMKSELKVLEEATHPNIMRVFELMEDSDSYFIVTEFISGGNLLQKLANVGCFTEDQAAKIIN